jgi:hypothetical protein
MVGVKDGARMRDVENLVGPLGPRNRHDPVDEVPRNREFRRHRRHAPKLPELSQRSVFHDGWQRFLFYLRLQLGEVVSVLFAQLAVDYAQLLLQVELTLVLEHRAANIVVDLPFQSEQVDFTGQELTEHFQQMAQRLCLEQRLAELEPHRDVRGDSECLPLRGVGALDDRDDLCRDAPVKSDVFLERVHHPAAQCLRLRRIYGARAVEREGSSGGAEYVAGGDVACHPGAGDSFHQHSRRACRKPGHLHDAADDAGAVQVSRCGFLFLSVALGDQQNELVFRERGFDGRERSRPSNEQRDDYIGENDNIPKRKDRDPVRRRDALVVAYKSWGQVLSKLPSCA